MKYLLLLTLVSCGASFTHEEICEAKAACSNNGRLHSVDKSIRGNQARVRCANGAEFWIDRNGKVIK